MPTWVVIAILAVATMWAVDHARKVRQIRKLRLEHGDIDARVSRGGTIASIDLISAHAKEWYIKNVEFAPKYIPSFSSTFVLDLAAAGQIIRGMVRDNLIVEVEGGTLADFSGRMVRLIYAAKNAGRNCVRNASATETQTTRALATS